jgi:hypothetical protein
MLSFISRIAVGYPRTRALAKAKTVNSSVTPLGSLNFYNGKTDHARLTTLPPTFGEGEFTFSIWIRGDETRSFGAGGGTNVWATDTNTIYDTPDWWFEGNFLVDGHNNTTGYAGTFSLQINSSGDVQWTFGDSAAEAARIGDLHGLRSTGLNVVDGNWHLIRCVRRWDGGSGSILELWVDGTQAATETSTARTNMQSSYWTSWTGFPANQQFWCFGGEKLSVLGGADWEDYWGEISLIEFWDRALTSGELASTSYPNANASGLVGLFLMGDLDVNERTYDEKSGSRYIQYYNEGSAAWTNQVP